MSSGRNAVQDNRHRITRVAPRSRTAVQLSHWVARVPIGENCPPHFVSRGAQLADRHCTTSANLAALLLLTLELRKRFTSDLPLHLHRVPEPLCVRALPDARSRPQAR